MSTSTTDIKEVVKEKYGQTASRLTSGKGGCCGSGSALASSCDPITSKLYSAEESGTVPETTVLCITRLREPDGTRAVESGRDRARSRIGAAASTSCCRRAKSGRPAMPTAWT